MHIFIQLFYSIASNVWCFSQIFIFSSIIQHSCMETKCSSCPWIVSEFASHQHCFCVVKICGHCVQTKHKKVRSAGKVPCSSQGWTRTNTGCVLPYCMVIHFLCFCEWRYSCGEDKLLCSSQCWSCADTVSVMCADVQLTTFCAFVSVIWTMSPQ